MQTNQSHVQAVSTRDPEARKAFVLTMGLVLIAATFASIIAMQFALHYRLQVL